MSIERTFDLIINAGTSSPLIINANQNDSGEIWEFNLYQEDGTKVIPAAGEIVGLKSDGHAIVNAGTVNESGQVVITETAQITAAVGANVFEIVFDSVHGTANFILYVEKSPVDDDADFSESDISAINQAIAMAIDSATVQAIQNSLAQESATRATQDAQLAGDISEEAATRAAADAVLRQAIDDAAIVPAGSTVVVDNTLSIAGAAADAKKTGDEISDLNQAMSDIETSSTNLFNPAYFLEADGFSKTSEGISAQATKFNAFWDDYYPFDEGIVFEENTQYTLSFKAKTDGSSSTSGNGIIAYIYHTDGTEVHEGVSNASSDFVAKVKTSTAGKTVRGIKFTYSTGTYNTWTIKDIQFVKGTTAPAFIPHFTAYDRQARADAQKAVNQLGEMISLDLLDGVSTHSGYMDLSGATHSSSSYVYTDVISVTPGDTIYTARARFVTFFNGSSAVSSKGLNYGDDSILTHEFEIPSGINGMVITLYSADTNVYARVNNRFWLTDKVANEI